MVSALGIEGDIRVADIPPDLDIRPAPARWTSTKITKVEITLPSIEVDIPQAPEVESIGITEEVIAQAPEGVIHKDHGDGGHHQRGGDHAPDYHRKGRGEHSRNGPGTPRRVAKKRFSEAEKPDRNRTDKYF